MISMQTFVCVPCGRGWPVEMGAGEIIRCTNCGEKIEARGIAWVRIPLQGGTYAGKSREAGR